MSAAKWAHTHTNYTFHKSVNAFYTMVFDAKSLACLSLSCTPSFPEIPCWFENMSLKHFLLGLFFHFWILFELFSIYSQWHFFFIISRHFFLSPYQTFLFVQRFFFQLRQAFHTNSVEFFFLRRWISSHFKGLSLVNWKINKTVNSNRSIDVLCFSVCLIDILRILFSLTFKLPPISPAPMIYPK